MLLHVPDILTPDQVTHGRRLLEEAQWVDGRVTAGSQSSRAKRNLQLPEDSPAARELGEIVLGALQRNALFMSAALPLKVFPPLFNRYGEGHTFGTHVDNAIRIKRGSEFRIRSDLSITVFLEDPAEYDGGELVVEDHFGVQRVKLPAGHAVVYPSSSLHHVTPVTRGVRVASFFWLQSMVRDDGARRILFDLDQSVQRLTGQLGGADRSVIELTGVYHNLLRRWADA